MATNSDAENDLLANANGASPRVDFERVSHCGELLIVIFYAEAYREAVTKSLEEFQLPDAHLRAVLRFAVFFMVTVRFFIGNFFHLADVRWNEDKWNNKTTRLLYYHDAFWIVLESLAMILLGGLGSVAANVNQLVIPLILISSLDVVWIAFQGLFDLAWRRFRPVPLAWGWFWLNFGVIVSLGFVLCSFWEQPLSVIALGWITTINIVAFAVDLWLNQKGA
jgi:hypothetical protein